MSQETDVIDGLTRLISDKVPSAQAINVEGLLRTSNGLSRENWAFDVSWSDTVGIHKHELILLRDATGSLLDTDRASEFAVLKALEKTSVPAPRVHWLDEKGQWLGTPSVVMDRVAGKCEWLVVNGSRPLAVRLKIARQFIDVMATIHAVDWRALGLETVLELPDIAPAKFELAKWESEFRRVQLEPLPELEYTLMWLEQTAPASNDAVLVHGDFKPGNALLENDRIRVMLDWETAHLGDPLEDLGWVTNPVRRREHQVPGSWERQQIMDAYSTRTGREISDSDLRWWNVFSCWKLAVIGLTGLNEFVAGRYDRVFQTPSWLFRPMFQLMEDAA